MSLHVGINRFNGGEVSPDIYGRWDLEGYESFLEKLSGFIPSVTGKAEMMTGFKYHLEQSDGSTAARLIPFEFTTADTFMLEFGDEYFRVLSTGDSVASVVSVSTVYAAEDLDEIQVKPLNDQLYLTHKDYPTQVVSRVSDSNWTIGDIPQDKPALIQGNTDTADTLSYSGTLTAGSSGTLSATGHAPFTADHVGGYWELTHWREADSVTPIDISGSSGTTNSSSLRVNGTYSIETSGFWWGELQVQESETGSFAGEEIVVYSRQSFSDANVNVSLETDRDVYIRLSFTSSGDPLGTASGEPFENAGTGPSGTAIPPASAKLSRDRSLVPGILKVTAFSSSTSVTAEVVQELESTSATWRWAEGAWSDYRGYPAAMVVFEQRLVFGGTVLNPTSMWYSETDNIGTWSPLGVEASDPIRTSISQDQNRILWMEAGKRILVGTGVNEYAITSSNLEAAITPTNITLKKQSSNGSSAIPAMSLGDTVLHVTRDGVGIQALNFSIQREGYIDNDVSRLSKHIFGSGVKQWAYQQNPNRIVWMLTGDGNMVGFVFNQREEVFAFFRRELEGTDVFESIATIRGTGKYDQLWATVNRGGVRTIERLADPTTTQSDMAYSDGHVIYESLGGTSVTGLPDFMEGREVIVWNDGAHEEPKTVASNAITLDNASTAKVIIGIQYEKEGIILPIEAPAGDGASRGKLKTITKIVVGTISTVQGYVGYKYIDGDDIEDESEPQLLFAADSDSFDGSRLPVRDRTWQEAMKSGSYYDIRPFFRGFGASPLNVTFMIVRTKPKGD